MNQQEIEEAVEAKLAAKLATHPAGPSDQDVETAVDALAAAIEAMPAGPSPADVRVAAMWPLAIFPTKSYNVLDN